MLKVGITGGIGSGKSTVSCFFSELGVPVYDSDQRAKSLMQHDDSIIIKIKKSLETIHILITYLIVHI